MQRRNKNKSVQKNPDLYSKGKTRATRTPHACTHTPVPTFGHTGGGWQGAFQDSWWKAGALWLLEGADSGDICASCCSAIVETLKVNYNINDSTLQAVVPYYASIIPCMGTQRHREGIGPSLPPHPPPTSLWKGAVYERIVGLWSSTFSCYSTSPHGMVLTGWLIPFLSISIPHFIFRASTPPPLTPYHPHPPHGTVAAISNNICLILPPSTVEWNQSGRDVMCEQKWLATRIPCIGEHGPRALFLTGWVTHGCRQTHGVAGACLIGITQTSQSCHPSPDFQ